jgi:acetyl-CoA carboxylase carboxyl transferase subunit alpha
MPTYLEFEKPIAELDSKIAELEALAARKDGPSITDELTKLKTKSAKQLKQIYSDLDAWRITQVARHPERPHCSDFIAQPLRGFRGTRRRPALRQ